jgi:hypothetical protein
MFTPPNLIRLTVHFFPGGAYDRDNDLSCRMSQPIMTPSTISQHGSSRHHRAARGQGGLVAIAVSMVVALVLAATTISGLSYLNAKRSVVTMQSLQTYYAAQAGIQEAIATRMMPGSNYLALYGSPNAYYTRSGKIYQDPSNTAKGVVGYYRFVVVGGDAARQANGNYYNDGDTNPNTGTPWLLENDSIPTTSPFVVMSNGITCVKNASDGLVVADQFDTSTPTSPTCKAGYTKQELTLVARARLQQPGPSGAKPKDQVDHTRTYKDKTKLRLPSPAFVPGYGWTDTNTDINFDTVWNYSGSDDAKDPVRLTKVVFYNFTDNTIDVDVNVNGANTTVPGKVPSNDAIRLYFNGPVDFRSIDPTMAPTMAGCKADTDTCRIRVVSNPPMSGLNHAYTGNTIIPLFLGSTQVILLPPLTNTIPGGTPHDIEVDAKSMMNYTGAKGTINYKVNFTTQ